MELTWRCECTYSFFSVDVQMEVTGRYFFYGECPRCGRRRRRGFSMDEAGYQKAQKMLRNTALRSMFFGKVYEFVSADKVRQDYGRRLTKMAACMGRSGRQAYFLIHPRVKMGINPVCLTATVHGYRECTLEDAPPFMDRVKRLRRLDTDKMRLSQVTDACIFCRIHQCDRAGRRCQMERIGEDNFRFLQLGSDT